MNLYQINQQLEAALNAVDEETGELLYDAAYIDELINAREGAVEDVALYCKNADAEAKAIREEEKALAERRRRLEARRERAAEILREALHGEKLTTARVAVSYRRSQSVEMVSEAAFWPWAVDHAEYVRRKDPEIDKVAVKNALKAGLEIPGAVLTDNVTMTIK